MWKIPAPDRIAVSIIETEILAFLKLLFGLLTKWYRIIESKNQNFGSVENNLAFYNTYRLQTPR